jgi:phosphate transport system protein
MEKLEKHSIDEACLHYLSAQGPKAKDLQWVLSMVKANVDLERVGDQATHIAEGVIFVSTGKDIRHGGNHS